MRILSIRGSNLASLAGEFGVDFQAEPLSSSGIFAITGPTGAGKSTLLDALCLALFAEIPRLRSAPQSQIGTEHGDTLTARDARSILRHGCPQGHAEVEFAMPDGHTYRAKWSVHRARKSATGALQRHNHELLRLTDQQPIGRTLPEVKAEIETIIGLNAEQFTRAVLLAQGEFEAFIRANAHERSLLLEKLTGSDIYARLGKKAFERAKEWKEQIQAIEAQIAAQNGLNDVQRAEAEAALESANHAWEEARKSLQSLQTVQQHYDHRAKLEKEVTNAEKLCAQSAQANLDADPRRLALARDKRALTLVPVLDKQQEAERRCTQSQDNIKRTQNALDAANSEIETCTIAKDSAQSHLDACNVQAKALEPHIQSARLLDAKLEDARAQWERTSLAAQEAAKTLASAQETAQIATTALDAVRDRHKQATQWCQDNDALRVLTDQEADLADLLRRHHANTAQHKDLSAKREQALADEHAALKRLSKAQDTARDAEAHYAEKGEALKKAQAHAPDSASQHRWAQRLQGIANARTLSTQTAHAHAAWLQGQASLGECEKHCADLQEQLSQAQENIATLSLRVPEYEAQHQRAKAVFERTQAATDTAAQVMRSMLVPGDACPVCGAKDHAVSELEAVLDSNLIASRQEEQDLELQWREASIALTSAQKDEARLTRDIAAAQQTREAHSNALPDLQIAYEDWLSRLNEALAALAIPALDEVADFADLETQLHAAQHEAAQQQDMAQTAIQALEHARQEETQARKARDTAQDTLHRASESLRTYAQAATELQKDISTLEMQMADMATRLDRQLGSLTDWANLPDPVAWLHTQVQAWRNHAQERDAAAQELPEREHAHREAQTTLTRLEAETKAAQDTSHEATTLRDELVKERALLLQGEDVQAVEARLRETHDQAAAEHERARSALETARREQASASAAYAAAQQQYTQDQDALTHAQEALQQALVSHGFTEADIIRVAEAGAEGLVEEEQALQHLAQQVHAAQVLWGKCNRDLEKHDAYAATQEWPAPDTLEQALKDATLGVKQAEEAHRNAYLAIRADDAVRERTESLRQSLSEVQTKATVWLELGSLMGDKEGKIMRTFAQGLTLDRLLEHANVRLADLKPRYALERGKGGDMLIQVIDNDMGGQVRGLHNLSGGERFLISLALALGLSEMSSTRGVKIESLFIDEGFGALDPASLGQALALLEQLQATGRRVGIISHVEELKERIPVKIEVQPSGRGTSTLTIVEG